MSIQKSGYIEVELLNNTKKNDSIYQAKIDLKQKFYTIYIYNYKKTVSEEFLNQFTDSITSDYFIIKIPEIEYTLQSINSHLSQNGLPFSKVTLNNISKNQNQTLNAQLQVTENKKRYVDKIIVKGYEKFPESYLNYFLKLKTKTNFNLEEIKEKTAKINYLNFANETKPPEIQFTKDSTTVYLYVNKRKSNNFDGFLGFGSNENSGKLEFNGYLNLNLTNNLNYGETLNLIYKSDESELRTFEANLVLPYLFKTPLGLDFSLNIFKKDSTFTTTNQKVNLFYQLDSKNKIAAGLTAIQSNTLTSQETSTANDYKSNFYSLNYNHTKPNFNQPLFPVNFYTDISLGTGKRDFENIKQNQTLLLLDLFKIFNFNSRNSLYIKTVFKSLFSDTYFENELFRFGGINSIRGFEENSLVANQYGLINSEYRYKFSSNIYLHSILDVAYLEDNTQNLKEKLIGFGIGLGLMTKAGLFKLNYANGKSENQNFKFSNSKIHISLNAKF